MVADGLTNGSVDRTEIITLYEKNIWKSIGDQPVSVSLCTGGGAHSSGEDPSGSVRGGAHSSEKVSSEFTSFKIYDLLNF